MLHEIVNPDNISGADIAVFIPSYEEAANIAVPVRKASIGLRKFYPGLSAVIVNCDNPAGDGTKEAFFQAECEVPRIYVSTPPGVRGKGGNLKNVFQLAADLSAKVNVLLDANLISVKSTWIPGLIEPVLANGFEYTAPLYVRHRYDSPISRALAYPMIRALYGRRVMQPICTDHAFSPRLAEIYRKAEWEVDDRGYKSDFKMLALAIINKAPICQSFMAHPRVTTMASLDYNLSKAFSYVIQAQFNLMMENRDFWRQVKRSRPTALAGADLEVSNPPPLVEIDRKLMTAGFIEQGGQCLEAWRRYFTPNIFNEIKIELDKARSGELPVMSMELWRTVIFQASAAYKNAAPDDRRELAVSLGPLFCIKSLTAYIKSEKMSEQQYSAFMESEALYFEKGKQELLDLWSQ